MRLNISSVNIDNMIYDNAQEIKSLMPTLNGDRDKKYGSGVIGVIRSGNYWVANIRNNKKLIILGIFKNYINAVKARRYAEKKLSCDKRNFLSSARIYLLYNQEISEFKIDVEVKKKHDKFSVEHEWNYYCDAKIERVEKLLE